MTAALLRHTLLTASLLVSCALPAWSSGHDDDGPSNRHGSGQGVQLGARPYYLIEGMDESKLKRRLQSCANGPFRKTDFSIGHRGAALQFPEHTKESYEAGARQGAGIVECDVTFTKDGELVCRHAECDLHTTTNIVATPLNDKCSTPWRAGGPAPVCCASDLTLQEFKSLKGKMDASNPAGRTPAEFMGGTAPWRTDLYNARGTLLTLRESIRLNKRLRVKHTPELKEGNPQRLLTVFGGQQNYAQKLIDELKAEGVNPRDAWPQSFNKDDVLYWIANEPAFGRQAVYLDDIDPTVTPQRPRLTLDELRDLRRRGVRIVAPPIFALLDVDASGEIISSQYAREIKSTGFDIITWTAERTDLRRGAAGAGFYYLFDPNARAVTKDSDIYKTLDALARKVGVRGIFSDWPATVSYYASCMNLE